MPFELSEVVCQKTGAPRNYEEFYYVWRDVALRMIRKCSHGLRDYQVQDLADTIMGSFVALDYLNPEDGGFTLIEKNGRVCSFKSFFCQFVRNRVYRVVDRKICRGKKNPRCVSSMSSGNDELDDVCFLDNVEAKEEPTCMVDFIETVDAICRDLQEMPQRRGAVKDLSVVFLALVEDLIQNGDISLNRVAAKFRVGRSAVRWWLIEIKCCSKLNLLY